MPNIRLPAVSGLFYPADPAELAQTVNTLLAQAATQNPATNTLPRAIIVPHAGYIYSGPVAASAYQRLHNGHATIKRVVLFGPSHRVAFAGLAVPDHDIFRTPLGDIPLDRDAIQQLLLLPQVHCLNQAHDQEHSLEVQLPFLQLLLDDFTLIPVVVGDASAADVAAAMMLFKDASDTLIVVSSDLSHYHDYSTAQQMDRHTSLAIEALQSEQIDYEDACGRTPVTGLLLLARQLGLSAKTIDLKNSGDTAGPRDRVVGYGAYVFQ